MKETLSTTEMFDKIIEKFKVLKKEAQKDCFFNKSDLDETFGISSLLIKWIDKKSEWTSIYRIFDGKRKKAYREVYEFYYKDFPMKLNSKEEYSMFIESDPNYEQYQQICLLIKEILIFIDSTIETLRNKSWEIKTYLEWLKFKNGVK